LALSGLLVETSCVWLSVVLIFSGAGLIMAPLVLWGAETITRTPRAGASLDQDLSWRVSKSPRSKSQTCTKCIFVFLRHYDLIYDLL